MASRLQLLKRGVTPPVEPRPRKKQRLWVAADSEYKPPQDFSERLRAAPLLREKVHVAGTGSTQRMLTPTVVMHQSNQLRKATAATTASSSTVLSAMEDEEMLWKVPLPGTGTATARLRLGQLGREAVGAKKMRQALAKRARARKRQQKNTWKLRACVGEATVLEMGSISASTSRDYRRRLTSFWDFADRIGRPVNADKEIDTVAADWSDLEFLSGENPEAGERQLSALEKWALVHKETSVVVLPRFKKIIKSWKKNAPVKSRLPMPEEFLWTLAGTLGYAGEGEMALYLVTLFETATRPTELLGLYVDDLVAPAAGSGYAYHTLVLAPVERESATKTGHFDQTVIMDGDLCPGIGGAVEQHCDRRARHDAAADPDGPIQMWGFDARAMFESFRGAVRVNRLPEMETLYQARHGSASRDAMLKKRSAAEMQLRLRHSTTNSLRIYDKPGRIQQLVRTLGAEDLKFAGEVQKGFCNFLQSGRWPRPPRLAGGLRLR